MKGVLRVIGLVLLCLVLSCSFFVFASKTLVRQMETLPALLNGGAAVAAALFALVVLGFLLAAYMITLRRLRIRSLMSDEHIRVLLEQSGLILMDFDSNKRILTYSESALRLLDIPPDTEKFHENLRGCIHPEDIGGYVELVERMYAGEIPSISHEVRMRTREKVYRHFIVKAQSLPYKRGLDRICGILLDITDKKELYLQMEDTKTHDALTGLLNRGKFLAECDRLLSGERHDEYSLLCIDIDHLSRINNLCGYAAGDSVLKQVAGAAGSCIDRETVFGRLGNDDFALLVRSVDREHMEKLFGRIASEVAQISVELLIRIPIRIHGGIAFPESGDDILSLLTKATAAQSVAKNGNEKLVSYEQGVRFLTLDREELTEDLRDAYETEKLDLWYQPKIDLKTQKLIGVEALMRWRHPKKGFIPPSMFIELAEQNGFIDLLDVWALRQACRQNKMWQEAGLPPVRISVNMSKALFRRADLIDSIKCALRETTLESRYLDIELTESLAVSDPRKTIGILKILRGMGVTVSMDDFGSGYASLGTLKTLPFDNLKIDRSLITDIDSNETSQRIAEAIIGIARSNRFLVVAEGTETYGQLAYLEQIGCDAVQGYYFGKPVPAEQFTEYFRRFG